MVKKQTSAATALMQTLTPNTCCTQADLADLADLDPPVPVGDSSRAWRLCCSAEVMLCISNTCDLPSNISALVALPRHCTTHAKYCSCEHLWHAHVRCSCDLRNMQAPGNPRLPCPTQMSKEEYGQVESFAASSDMCGMHLPVTLQGLKLQQPLESATWSDESGIYLLGRTGSCTV